MAEPVKQYGLIRLPKKEKKSATVVPKPSIFDDNSDEDGMAATNKEILLASQKNKTKRQTQMEMDKALADDPTVYAYDELYDDMKREEKETSANVLNQTKTANKKSLYITGLLKASEKRKKENERRTERKVQKEREEEGDEFADKEKFVTSAYKKKMAEMQKLEQEESRKEKLEEILDVTRQRDMSGFYRSLYNQTLGKRPDKLEPAKAPDDQAGSRVDDVKSEPTDEASSETHQQTPSKRTYRSRQDSASSDERKSNNRKHRDHSNSASPPHIDDKTSENRSIYRSRSKERIHRRPTSKDRSHEKSTSGNRLSESGERTKREKETSQRQRSADRKPRSRSRDRKQRPRNRDRKHRSRSQERSRSRSPRRPLEKPSETKPESEKKTAEERFARRNDTASVQNARERYLARMAAKMATQ